ncbi:hypothetical protein LL967_20860, partial [Xanthomonas campestris pv. zinniae]|nr:hypothetical protein [Xanthomonas campestris pv. zinniae]
MAIAQRRVRGALTRLLAGGFIEEWNQRSRTFAGCLIKALRTDQLDWSLPAHRRGTLSGMDAAP